MNNQLANFKEFLRTPFPYMFVALTLFLSSTMLTNQSFYNSLVKTGAAVSVSGSEYTLCLVCSDPNAKDMLSDLGFTVANLVLFPVSAVAFLINTNVSFIFGTYIALSALYGIAFPFLIFTGYQNLDKYLARRRTHASVYSR